MAAPRSGPLAFLRRLRGLRVQLLIWTILPLAAAMVVFSLLSITRHRAAMSQLVEDRNRGLALGEANRLAREISSRSGLLAQAVARGAPASLRALSSDALRELGQAFPSGLALVDDQGRVVEALQAAHGWTDTDALRVLAARSVTQEDAQYESHFAANEEPHVLIGIAAGQDRALIGAAPAAAFGLTESGGLIQTESNGTAFVLDNTGRVLFTQGPPHVHAPQIADLPAAAAGQAGAAVLTADGHEMLVTYARVAPPGWTLAVVEDVHAIDTLSLSVVELLPLALLFVALLALLALSCGAVNIVRPLQELDRRARRVAWGDFDAVNEPVGGVQEVDELRITLAQMADRIRTYQAGMRDYLSAVTRAQEAEAERLAHELHDDTVQALIALRQRAQMARKACVATQPDPQRAGERLGELIELIDQELVNLRRLIGDLRPIYLEDLGFVPALEMLVQQVGARHALEVGLTVVGETVRLAPDVELAAYRIVQQALANVATHAHARHVMVRVQFRENELVLAVKDDGRGFLPPEQPADLARNGHFGLMGMRERALLYGGKLVVESAPGQGALITAHLPVSRQA